MVYSIGTFSKITGLSADTLRYYEKEGLILPERDLNNRRIYSEKDIDWVEFILKLKETAMPISQIKTYARLRYEGDSTLEKRLDLLLDHQRFIYKEKEKLEQNILHLNKKIDIYKEAIKKQN
ncbi:MerR family transcriptional regulator [Sporolactobacillus laevolacticus]|uniref:MerR family transcriptional regulator n=1 Tax=Sporolactobacillus laevolacticus TaxID=33018 RepID=UPI0025B5DD61|nr:MerR family transcriptional regulator [Sporolactobacillus laevolacticus]MDN3954627.1 MerR family transcriptional regulator [Sporolactobacillus laevolacticus]